jgi:hypothetical protein
VHKNETDIDKEINRINSITYKNTEYLRDLIITPL